MSKLLILLTFLYILPPQFLFEEDLRQRQKLKTLSFNQEITLIHEKLPQGKLTYRERVYLKTADVPGSVGQLRIETSYPDSLRYQLRLLIDSAAQLWDYEAGSAMAREKLPPVDWWLLFYLYQDAGSLINKLEQLGFDISRPQLDKLGGKTVYRLVNSKLNRTLWFDKELIHPVGYSFESQGKLWSIRWDQVTPYNDEIYFPQEVQILVDNVLIETRRLPNEPRMNQQLLEDIFQSPKISKEANSIPETDKVKFIKQLRVQYP